MEKRRTKLKFLIRVEKSDMAGFLFVSSPFKLGACSHFPGLARVEKRIGHAAIN
jgi:hypothetical protein